ncbi:MAG: GNAT family N-acetyltransferase [Woeseia sp.]|nr:GNAT family N-acetyltransferase [Woeseia sp.]
MVGKAQTGPVIRAATADDVADMHALIVQLAVDTGMQHRVTSTADDLLRAGFGEEPEFAALLATDAGRSVGLSLFYYEYSTWRGVAGVYLQDLIVLQEYRGGGLARRLVQETVRAGKQRGADYLRLSVDADNQKAIGFYRAIGLDISADEQICYARDAAFERLAGES